MYDILREFCCSRLKLVAQLCPTLCKPMDSLQHARLESTLIIFMFIFSKRGMQINQFDLFRTYYSLRKRQTRIFLPGESHGQRSLAGYRPWGRKESDTTERLTLSVICQALCLPLRVTVVKDIFRGAYNLVKKMVKYT